MILQPRNGIAKARQSFEEAGFLPKALCFHDMAMPSGPLSLAETVDFLEETTTGPMLVDVTG